jgi:exodeoxyribonuclease-1
MGLDRLPAERTPFLHVSGMFPAERGCVSVVWPLATHPTNKNEVLVWDCRHDPSELFALDVDTVRIRLFTRAADMPEGMTRLPIKSVHLNKSPMLVANLKTLDPVLAAQWQLDIAQCKAHARIAADGPDLKGLWQQVYARPGMGDDAVDIDEDLYGGFVPQGDRRALDILRMGGHGASAAGPPFEDERLADLLFRYRARNFPDTLQDEETQAWEAHRAARLFDGAGGARTIEQLFAEIDALSEDADERAEGILGALYDYAEMIAPQRV